MHTQILDGKKLATKIQLELKKRLNRLVVPPRLDVIWVGDNPASQVYVHHKEQVGTQLGVNVQIHHMNESITQQELTDFIQNLNDDDAVDGILVQLPLPKHLNEQELLETILPEKDVDGLTSFNLGRLLNGYPQMIPCTPMACMELIRSVCPDLTGKTAVIIGRSRLVGKPLFQLLLAAHCTVIQAHSKTTNLTDLSRMADILVVATGHAGLIGKNDIKLGAIVIDVGINRLPDGHLVGDVKTQEVMGLAKALTPVPGGVGPMTVTMLFQNVIQAAEKKNIG